MVVGHDLGGILLQQFLERGNRLQIKLAIDRAIFVNSSVYADLYRPTPAQTALADPVHGPAIARAISGPALEGSMAPLFPGHPLSAARFAELWAAIEREDGHHLWPQQLIYMSERAALGGVWEKALHDTSTPLGFVYGLADPISGAQILSHAEADLPDAMCIGLAGLGHFPQVEAAADVARALRVILDSEIQA
jgi:pimeloyl-ACP methyl ester carboxylesterase